MDIGTYVAYSAHRKALNSSTLQNTKCIGFSSEVGPLSFSWSCSSSTINSEHDNSSLWIFSSN